MGSLSELEEYNKSLFNKLNEKCVHFQIGFFNPDSILFIGQNPGVPFTDEQEEKLEHVTSLKTFEEHEDAYTEQWKESLFGLVIYRIIDGDWSKVSFTNYVKVPTLNNTTPGDDLVFEYTPIILRQIYLLKPKLIVCLGKFVGKQFNIDESYKLSRWFGLPIVMFPHPSYITRQGTQYMNNEIKRMKSFLGLISI
jgi:uracil-DNA glycosylase